MKRNAPRLNNPARLARLRDQAIKLRDRVKRSKLAFIERNQARFTWWQRAFRVPMVADWAIFTKAKSLLSAFMALLGLAGGKKSSLVALMVEGSAPLPSCFPPRSAGILCSGKPEMRNTSRESRRLHVEGLEQRQLMATDVSVIGNDLVIEDLTGGNNLLSLSRSGANLVLSDANEQFTTGIAGAVLSNGNKTVTVPVSSLGVAGKIIVKTLDGSDSLSVDVSTDLGFNVDYQGGSGISDSLTLVADTVTSVTHAFTNANDGSITIVDGGSRVISYTGLEPITDNLIATDRIFTFNFGAETITVSDSGGGDGMMTIDSDVGSESVAFVNPTGSLTINAGTGDDIVNIFGLDDAFRGAVSINGDAGTDTVNWNAAATLGSASATGNVSVVADEITVVNDIVAVTGRMIAVSLAATGDIRLNDNVVETGGGTFTVNADSDANNAGTFTLDRRTLVSASGGSISIKAADVSMAGELSGTSTLTLAPSTAGRTIGIGGGTGAFNLSDLELGRLIDGFSSITIGDATAGNIDINTATFTDSVVLKTSGKVIDATGADIDVGVGNSLTINGNVAPGQSPGILNVTGNLQVNADSVVLLSDDFNDNSIDTAKWKVVTAGIPQAGASVIETGGRIRITGRGHLNTVAALNPNAPGGLVITGTWQFGSSDDRMQILTRSNGTPSGAFGDTGQGIELLLNNNTLSISGKGSAAATVIGGTGVVIPGGVSVNDVLEFTLTDDGTTITGKITVVGNPSKTATVTATSNFVSATNLVTFHNRESGRVSFLDNVVISSASSGYSVEIGGTTPGESATSHDQINVTGTVTIGSGVRLNLSNFMSNYTPSGGDRIVIVNNDASDAIIGTFVMGSGGTDSNGGQLANGDTITNFLGSSRSFKLFYNGGDGNDVVLEENSTPAVVYVDDSFTGNLGQTIADADLGTTGSQPAIFGATAFTTINAAMAAVTTSGTIIVNGGTYAETVSLTGTRTMRITGQNSAQTVIIDDLTTIAGTPVIIEGSSNLTVGDVDSRTLAGVISGSGSFTKVGAGTLTLPGSNLYTGATAVNNGTLMINGSVTSNVTVTTPSVLNGSGTVTGNVLGNGTFSPGNGTGIMTIVGNFTPSGTVNFEVNSSWTTAGTHFDQYLVTGLVNLAGSTVTFTNIGDASAPAANSIIKLIDNNGAIDLTTAPTTPVEGASVTIGSRSFKLSYNGGDGNDVVLTSVTSSSDFVYHAPLLTPWDLKVYTENATLFVTNYQTNEVLVLKPISEIDKLVDIKTGGTVYIETVLSTDGDSVSVEASEIIVSGTISTVSKSGGVSPPRAGDLKLIARNKSNDIVSGIAGFVPLPIFADTRSGAISLTNANLDVGNVEIKAEGQSGARWDDIGGIGEKIADSLLSKLQTVTQIGISVLLPLSGQAKVHRAKANITLENATIKSSGDVAVEADAFADASINAISLGGANLSESPVSISIAFSHSFSEATINLNGSSKIDAPSGNIKISTNAESKSKVDAKSDANTGIQTGIEAAFNLALAMTEENSTILIGLGSEVNGSGSVDIKSNAKVKNESAASTNLFQDGTGALTVALGFDGANVKTEVYGTVTSRDTRTQNGFAIAASQVLPDTRRIELKNVPPSQVVQEGDRLRFESNAVAGAYGLVPGETYIVESLTNSEPFSNGTIDQSFRLRRGEIVSLDARQVSEGSKHSLRKIDLAYFKTSDVSTQEDKVGVVNLEGLPAGVTLVTYRGPKFDESNSSNESDEVLVGIEGLIQDQDYLIVPATGGGYHLRHVTKLKKAIDNKSTTTTVAVQDISIFPQLNAVDPTKDSFPFNIRIGSEEMSVVSRSGRDLTVVRAVNGTTIADHAMDAFVSTASNVQFKVPTVQPGTEQPLTDAQKKQIHAFAYTKNIQTFEPSKENVVDPKANTILLPANHGFKTGDFVIYETDDTKKVEKTVHYYDIDGKQQDSLGKVSLPDAPIDGLGDYHGYRVIVDPSNPNLIRLSSLIQMEKLVGSATPIYQTIADSVVLDNTNTPAGNHRLVPIKLVQGINISSSLEAENTSDAGSTMSDEEQPASELASNALSGRLDSIAVGGMKWIDSLRKGVTTNAVTSAADKAKTSTGSGTNLDVAGSFALNLFNHNVATTIGSKARLVSDSDLTVDGKIEQKTQLKASAEATRNGVGKSDGTVTAATNPPAAPPAGEEKGDEIQIAAAVAVGVYSNKLNVTITDGAVVNAADDLQVNAKVEYPLLSRFEDAINPLKALEENGLAGFEDTLDGSGGIGQMFNVSVTTLAGLETSRLALGGGIAVTYVTNEVTAEIGKDVLINQPETPLIVPDPTQSVTVTAELTAKVIEVGQQSAFNLNIDGAQGVVEKLFSKEFATALSDLVVPFGVSGKSAIGGVMVLSIVDNDVTAKIHDNAKVAAKDRVSVDAKNAYSNISVVQTGTASTDFGFTAAIAVGVLDLTTVASIDETVTITTGKLAVNAKDESDRIAIVGGFLKGKQVGIGISVGVNVVDQQVDAFLGRSTIDVNSAAPTDKKIFASEEVNVTATTKGEIFALVMAGALQGNLKKDKPAATAQSATSPNAVKPNTAKSQASILGPVALTIPVAINIITSDVKAYIDRQNFETESVTVEALTETSVLQVVVGASFALQREQVAPPVPAGKMTLGGAGAVALAMITQNSSAFIQNSIIIATGTDSITVKATDKSESDIYAGGIGVAGSFAKDGKAAISFGASVAINDIDGATKAFISESQITASGAVNVNAIGDSKIFTLSMAGGVSANSSAQSSGSFAGGGTISLNDIEKTLEASILSNTTLTVTANAPTIISATDQSKIFAIAGAAGIAVTASTGTTITGAIGIALSINDINNTISAKLDKSKVDTKGDLTIDANAKNAEIKSVAVAASVGVSKATGVSVSLAGAGAGSLNDIGNTVSATMTASNVTFREKGVLETGAPETGRLNVLASDNSTITSYAIGASITAAVGTSNSVSVAIGGSLGLNEIDNTVSATIDASTITLQDTSTGTSSLNVLATDTSIITSYAIGAAISAAIGSSNAVAVPIGIALGFNDINNTTQAVIKANSKIAHDSTNIRYFGANITAKQNATINSTSVAASVGVGVGQNGIAVSIAGALAKNEISNQTRANIVDSTLSMNGDLKVTADDKSKIDALATGASIAGAVGGTTAVGVAIGGAAGSNTTTNTVSATIDKSNISWLRGDVDGTLDVLASNTSAINSKAIGAAVSAAVGATNGVAVPIAISLGSNEIKNTVEAVIKTDSKVTQSEDDIRLAVNVTANQNSTIDSKAVAASVGVGVGGTTGIAVGIAGALAKNEITNQTLANIVASTLSLNGDLKVTADDTSKIESLATGASIAGAVGGTTAVGVAIGGAAGSNTTTNTVSATIDNSGITLLAGDTGGGTLEVLASNTSTINSKAIGAAVSAAVGGTNGVAVPIAISLGSNKINNKVEAAIKTGSKVTQSETDVRLDVNVTAKQNSTIDSKAVAASVGVGAGGTTGVAVGIAGALAENEIENQTLANIVASTLSLNGNLTVTADDISKIESLATGASVAGAVGGTTAVGVAIGGAAGSNTTTNTVSATIDNSNITLLAGDTGGGTLAVRASNTSSIKSEAIGAAVSAAVGGTAGVAVPIAISLGSNKINNKVEAVIKTNSDIFQENSTRFDVTVTAKQDSTIDSKAVAASVGVGAGGEAGVAVAIAGALAKNEIENKTLANILASSISLNGNLKVTAEDISKIDSLATGASISAAVGGAAGVGVGAAGSVGSNVTKNTVSATIDASKVTLLNMEGSKLDVVASDKSTIESKAIGAAISAAVGGVAGVAVAVGISVGTNEINNTVEAVIKTNSTVTHAREVTEMVDVNVTAKQESTITTTAVAAAVGVGVGGTAGVAVSGAGAGAKNTINNQTRANIVDTTLSTTGNLTVKAEDTATIDGKITAASVAAAGGIVGVGAALGVSYVENIIPATALTQAKISGGQFTVGGKVTVDASSTGKMNSDVNAVSIGFAAGAGAVAAAVAGVYASHDLSGKVEAQIVGSSDKENSAVSGVSVNASNSITSDLDVKSASVTTAVGAGAAVSLSVSSATTTLKPMVSATIRDAKLSSSDGNIEVTADNNVTVNNDAATASVAASYGGFAIAGGGALATVTATPQVNAMVQDSDLTGKNVTVSANSTDTINAESKAAAIALALGFGLGAAGSISKVTLEPALKSEVIKSKVVSEGTLEIRTKFMPMATADSAGLAVGTGAAVGLSSSDVTIGGSLDSRLDANGKPINVGVLTIYAYNNTDGKDADNIADNIAPSKISSAKATGASGGLLLGANGAIANIANTTNSTAEIADNTASNTLSSAITVTGKTDIRVNSATSQTAEAGSLAVGLRSTGNTLTEAKSDNETTARIGTNVILSTGDLTLRSISVDNNISTAKLGSFGGIGIALSKGDTTTKSVTKAIIDDDAKLTVTGKLDADANHTSKYNAKMLSLSGGIISGSGGVVNNNIDSTVNVNIGSSTMVTAGRMDATATNTVEKKDPGTDDNVDAVAGGLIAGVIMKHDTTLTLNTTTTIGENAKIDLKADDTIPSKFEAFQDIKIKDKVKFKAGGLAAGGALLTNITSTEHNIGVTVGVAADIKAKSPIHFAANEHADVTIQANSDAYGAATATGNRATIDLKPIKSVTIGSNAKVFSTKDVALLAGMTPNLEIPKKDDYKIASNVDAFAGSLIPLDINDSDAHLLQTNTIVVTQGAEVKSGGDILLYADGDDYQRVSAQAKSVNWTNAIQTSVNSVVNLLTGDAEGGVGQFAGESSTKANATVTVNGTLETGIGRHKTLVIEKIEEPAETDRDKPEAYRVVLSKNSDFSDSDLVKKLEPITSVDQTAFFYAKAQLKLPGVSQQLKQFYEAEVIRLRAKITSQGLLKTTPNGLDEVKTIQTLGLTIPPITASSGAIRIFADKQDGTGTLTAPSDPSITITNRTDANLTTSQLTIPDHNGGVFLNNILTTERTTTPTIKVENEAIVSADTGRAWPGINVQQSINNPSGDVTLKNYSAGAGSININGNASILAATQTITAGLNGTLNISLGGANSVFEAGGSAYKQVLPFTGPVLVKPDGTGFFKGKGTGAIDNFLNQPLNALNGSTSVLRGARIILKAAYINLNGLIESGRTDYTLVITPEMHNEAGELGRTKPPGLYRLTTNKNDAFTVQFNNDPLGYEYVVSDFVPVGGNVEIHGHLANTGGGKIQVASGYPSVKIESQVGQNHPIKLKNIDLSQRADGRLVINDSYKPNESTIYESHGDYIYKSGVRYELTSNHSYQPVEGLRYGFTIVEDLSEKIIEQHSSRSFLGFDALGYDPATRTGDPVIIPLGEPRITDSGVYFFIDTNNRTNDFLYNSTTIDTGFTRSTKYDTDSYTPFYALGAVTTYYWKIDTTQGTSTSHNHSIRADRPIAINFTGLKEPKLDIDWSYSRVTIDGIVGDDRGVTNIKNTGGVFTTDRGLIQGRQITLTGNQVGTAVTPVRTDLADRVAFDYLSDEPVKADSPTRTTYDGERVRVAANHIAGGDPGTVYVYRGAPLTQALSTVDYSNEIRWDKVTKIYFDYQSNQAGSETSEIADGTRVQVDKNHTAGGLPGTVYVYRNVLPPLTQRLSTVNYADTNLWQALATSFEEVEFDYRSDEPFEANSPPRKTYYGQRVRVGADHTVGGNPGWVYVYQGAPSQQVLSTVNYANSAFWQPVVINDIQTKITNVGPHDTNIHEVSGDLVFGEIKTKGNTWLRAAGGIHPMAEGAEIHLDPFSSSNTPPLLSLITNTGDIGKREGPVVIRTPGKVSFSAKTPGDVWLSSANDLAVNQIRAGGIVAIGMAFGTSIVDANFIDVRDERAIEELTENVWKDLQLTKLTGFDAKLANRIAALEASKTSEYRTYWDSRNQTSAPENYTSGANVAMSQGQFDDLRPTLEQEGRMGGLSGKDLDLYVFLRRAEIDVNRTEELHRLHQVVGAFTAAFNPEYKYTATNAEKKEIEDSMHLWTEQQLQNLRDASFVASFLKITDTELVIEQPNIIGTTVAIITDDESYAVGQTIVLKDAAGNRPKLNLDQRAAIVAAETADLIFTTQAPVQVNISVVIPEEGSDIGKYFLTLNYTITGEEPNSESATWSGLGFKAGQSIMLAGDSGSTTTRGVFYKVKSISRDGKFLELASTMTDGSVLRPVKTPRVGQELNGEYHVAPVITEPDKATHLHILKSRSSSAGVGSYAHGQTIVLKDATGKQPKLNLDQRAAIVAAETGDLIFTTKAPVQVNISVVIPEEVSDKIKYFLTLNRYTKTEEAPYGASGTWRDLDFKVGQSIMLAGNPGSTTDRGVFYKVESISPDGKSLELASTMTDGSAVRPVKTRVIGSENFGEYLVAPVITEQTQYKDATHLHVLRREDVDIQARDFGTEGSFSHFFIGSEGDLKLGNVKTTGTIQIKTNGDLSRFNDRSKVEANVVLLESANGKIGAIDQPLRINKHDETILRAKGDIHAESSDDSQLRVKNVYSGTGDVDLKFPGGFVDLCSSDVAIRANKINLATNDSLGDIKGISCPFTIDGKTFNAKAKDIDVKSTGDLIVGNKRVPKSGAEGETTPEIEGLFATGNLRLESLGSLTILGTMTAGGEMFISAMGQLIVVPESQVLSSGPVTLALHSLPGSTTPAKLDFLGTLIATTTVINGSEGPDEVRFAPAASSSGEVQIAIDAVDSIDYVNNWKAGRPVVKDGQFYHVLGSGAQTLRVKNIVRNTNPILPSDVNADGRVEPLDVLLVINYLNRRSRPDVLASDGPMSSEELALFMYYDVSADGVVAPIDVLRIINFLIREDRAAQKLLLENSARNTNSILRSDVDANRNVSPLDGLGIINPLGTRVGSAEGEFVASSGRRNNLLMGGSVESQVDIASLDSVLADSGSDWAIPLFDLVDDDEEEDLIGEAGLDMFFSGFGDKST